ncbi:MAG: TetM/TetW/TetO/TetS family tetracycline resistance ribosomal protection protein [Oscillibacter sp.]|nr:TetM/TetW/TetO/TetS family tetracycline resistance ribosomal protection protein [Oscillibacter sp.]
MGDIINIGIVAHADAGKTTLTEQMLYAAGELRTLGSVDRQNTQTDWLDIERQRGISVKASSTRLFWKDCQINLIDTPGHVDFAGEVQRSLSVLDAAVLVVSAAEGIQGQTEALWDALRKLEIPTLLFINKIDRIGAEPQELLGDLAARFSPDLAVMERWENAQDRACRVFPLELTEGPLGDFLTELAAENDPEAETCFLEDRPVPAPVLRRVLKEQIAACKAFPVYLGAAALGVGVGEVLDGVQWLPKASRREDGPLSGVVYRVEHDKAMGKTAHVRLFSGTISNRDPVPLRGREPVEKVTQIRRVLANRYTDMGRLTAGDIGALYGLSNARTGDIIGDEPLSRAVTLAVPLLKVQVFPKAPEQMTELVAAIRELAEEEPLLDMEWEKEERELYIKITGMIQLEVIGAFLRDRFGLEASFASPSVIYKETPARPGVGIENYTWPKPCWACIEFAIEPLARGAGFRFESAVGDRVILSRYQAHIAQALPEALKQGLYGWEVTDLKITLTGGSHHLIHTHPLDFFTATPMALMNGLENTGCTLLEPMVTMRFSAGEEHVGRLIRDVIAMRGSFDSPVIHKDSAVMEARVPVSESLTYPVDFGILTGGRGVLSSRFSGYEPCPIELGKTAKRRGIDPRDRSKWILHARQAL